MSLFKNRTIAFKIAFLVGVPLLLMLLQALFTIKQMQDVSNDIRDIAEYDSPMLLVVSRMSIVHFQQKGVFQIAVRHGISQATEVAAHFRIAVDEFHTLSRKMEMELARGASLVKDARQVGQVARALEEADREAFFLVRLEKAQSEFVSRVSEVFALFGEGQRVDAMKLVEVLEKSHDAMQKDMVDFLAEVEGFAARSVRETQEDSDKAYVGIRGIMVLGLMLGILFAVVFIRAMTRPLGELTRVITKMAETGDFTGRVEVVGLDEVGRLGTVFNQMAHTMGEQYWLKASMSELSAQMQQAATPDAFAQTLMDAICPLLHAGHGVFYIFNEASQAYELFGSYGYAERKNLSHVFKVGQGVVGQCAREGKIIILTQAPSDYVCIRSGLGEAAPLTLMAVPAVFQGKTLAVLEVASFHVVTPVRRTLMEDLAPIVAMGLENLLRARRTQELLEQSQRQTEELQAQSEELQSQQEELQSQQEELQSQQEELRQSNEELTSNTELLQEQKAALETTQAELYARSRALEDASRYKSEFLANMSHELRTPLNSMLLLVKNLNTNAEGRLSAEQVGDTGIIYQSGMELLGLIDDILDLSKVEAGKLVIRQEEQEIHAFAERVRTEFHGLANQKHLTFTVEVTPDAPVLIQTDGSRMAQIVRNFLSNAVKFTESGGVVGVRIQGTNEPGKVLAVAVSDTGPGIPLEQQKLIFEAFAQGDGGMDRKYGGTGLGLSISRRLAQLLGGEIRLVSALGQGSVFTLLLPASMPSGTATPLLVARAQPTVKVASPQCKTDERSIAIKEPSDTKDLFVGKVALIVDDDMRNSYALDKILRQWGFVTCMVNDGEKALQWLEGEEVPDLILTDIMMPNADGFQLVRRMRAQERFRSVHIIVLSARVVGNIKEQCLQAGANGYLPKPVDLERLLSTLSVWLRP